MVVMIDEHQQPFETRVEISDLEARMRLSRSSSWKWLVNIVLRGEICLRFVYGTGRSIERITEMQRDYMVMALCRVVIACDSC